MFFGNGNCCWIIIILLLLWCFCGEGFVGGATGGNCCNSSCNCNPCGC
jgi:hypothetical protein